MKSKKIIIVSHCVLNQNSVVEGWARAKGAYPIAALLLDEGVGIIQLPCPEMAYKGLGRPPLGYDDYNEPAYKTLCCDLVRPIVMQLKDYLKSGYVLTGIIAIENSPTCAISGRRGVLMEVLLPMLVKDRITVPFVEIPETYREGGSHKELEKELIKLIRS